MTNQLIILTPEQLTELISQSLKNALAEQSLPSSHTTKPLNIEEAAAYLGIPKATLYQMTSTREIPHKKLGKRLVFLARELDEWVLSKKKKTRSEIEHEAICQSKQGYKK